MIFMSHHMAETRPRSKKKSSKVHPDHSWRARRSGLIIGVTIVLMVYLALDDGRERKKR